MEPCPRCLKPLDLCVCPEIRELKTTIEVLILQHPQEPDKDLGSARLAQLSLPRSSLKVGLSWPNLTKALGRPAVPAEWAVLYLGSGIKDPKPPGPGLHFVTKQGGILSPRPAAGAIRGLIVLDGTWSQAKTIWWRNAWLLKLKRAILVPTEKSLYRELRREPRRECLSTIETIAEALRALGESAEVEDGLKAVFSKLLTKQRARLAARRKG